MHFQRYYLDCLSHASYLVADEASKTAAVIDPQRDVDQYIQDAEALGVQIRYVFLTHFHADFVAGHIELAERTGAKILLGHKAEPKYDFVPLRDGDVIEFGQVRFRVLETPGHTPESISLVVYDLAKSDEVPFAVFTGDLLFVGDVGRPDLLASIGVSAEELASMLYDSLQKLLQLPDDVRVYPAHGAGSLCGKQLGDAPYTTIGQERRSNAVLQAPTREAFIQSILKDQPPAPAYFLHDAIVNRESRRPLEEVLEESLVPMQLDAVLEHRDKGAQIVDTRSAESFAQEHLRGSLNIGLDGKYAHWCGTLLDPKRPVIVIADPGRERESIMRLGRIGFDNVLGYLDGGPAAFAGYPEHTVRTARIEATDLATRLESASPPVVVDVRSPKEWENGHIPGSRVVPLPELAQRLEEVPRDRPVAVHCEGGYRSSIATSLLQARGYDQILDLVGGMKAWRAAGLPVEAAEAKATASSS